MRKFERDEDPRDWEPRTPGVIMLLLAAVMAVVFAAAAYIYNEHKKQQEIDSIISILNFVQEQVAKSN